MKNKLKTFLPLFLLALIFYPVILCAAEVEIDKIEFRHVHFDGDEDLEDIINSSEGDAFDARLIKLDKILLTNYYKKNGFLDVSIRDSLIYKDRKRKVRLIYKLKEGPRYYFAGPRFKGHKTIPLNELVKQYADIKLRSPFDESKITVAKQRLENLYYNAGKPYATIKIDYLFESDSLIYVLNTIDEQQTVYIKDIEYYGLKLVQKFLIRRELEIKKGERYNRELLDRSQQNLYASGLFRYVRFEIEPVEGEESQAILKILVQEKDPRWIGVRLGLAHEQEAYYGNKMEITLQGGHRNIYGTARSVSLHVTPSIAYDFSERKLINPDNKIAFMYIEPWILNTRTPGIVRLTYQQYRPLYSGDFNLWRASFDVRRKHSKDVELSASIAANLIDRVGNGAIDSTLVGSMDPDKSSVYALTFYGKRDKRENIFNPANSSYVDMSLAFSYSSGKDELKGRETNQYITMITSWQRYQPWRPKVLNLRRWNFIFATRLKAGAIFEPFATKTIPLSDRLYAGGSNTVRGYQEQLLGPAAAYDEKGHISQAAGGKLLFLGNAEARIPLFWLLYLETFVDMGNVWREISDFRAGDIRFTTGLGLAVMSPLGPVRVDYGYKLMRQKTDPSNGAFHLGLYFAF